MKPRQRRRLEKRRRRIKERLDRRNVPRHGPAFEGTNMRMKVKRLAPGQADAARRMMMRVLAYSSGVRLLFETVTVARRLRKVGITSRG